MLSLRPVLGRVRSRLEVEKGVQQSNELRIRGFEGFEVCKARPANESLFWKQRRYLTLP